MGNIVDTHADKSIIHTVRGDQGEMVKLGNDGATPQKITNDEIARFALAIYKHSWFFSLRRGLSIRFSSDLNGSGTQGLFIKKEKEETGPPYLIDVVFTQTFTKDCEFLYEADLWMDGRKDYEPGQNKGKHRFRARSAAMQIDWIGDEAQQWRLDIERLSRSPDTLTGWIADDLEMLVICQSCSVSYFLGRKPAILTNNDLQRHVSAGLSLEDLKIRLKCSECGKRRAHVSVF